MTDDPEITDPRDPHKRRDIVAELDRWLVSRASLHEATVSHALLQGARDEIVALRAAITSPGSPGWGNVMIAAHRNVARAEALEEAAQMCFRANPQSNPNAMGHAIRALKDKRHD